MSSQNQKGFTLVELISVIAASGIFISLVLYFGINYWRYSSLLESDSTALVNRLNVQDIIRESIGTSSGLIIQNSLADPNAAVQDPVAGSSYWFPLHAVPQTTTVTSGTTTPLLYYRRFSVDSSKNIILNGTQPYEDEYVLYVDGTTKQLRLRTLANNFAANNVARTSCPPASATVSCPSDKVLLEELSAVKTAYYSRSGNSVNYQSVTDPVSGAYIGPDFTAVESLQYTFTIKKKTLFQTANSTTNDTVVRIALRNT